MPIYRRFDLILLVVLLKLNEVIQCILGLVVVCPGSGMSLVGIRWRLGGVFLFKGGVANQKCYCNPIVFVVTLIRLQLIPNTFSSFCSQKNEILFKARQLHYFPLGLTKILIFLSSLYCQVDSKKCLRVYFEIATHGVSVHRKIQF